MGLPNYDTKKRMHCEICKKNATLAVCGNCNTVAYCGKDCQTRDWNNKHHMICDVMVEKRRAVPKSFERRQENVLPSWIPTKKQIDAVPPMPSSVRAKLKSDAEVRHVQRLRKAKWLESIIEDVFANSLRERGVDEASIKTLMSLRSEFEETYTDYATNATLDKPAKMQILIRKFDLMLEALIGSKQEDPTWKMQISNTKSDIVELCDVLAHQSHTFMDIFPNDNFYKDDEETRSYGFEPNVQFEIADQTEVTEQEFLPWLISDEDMKLLAQHKFASIDGFCDETGDEPAFEEEDDDIVRAGLNLREQFRENPDLLYRSTKTYTFVRKMTEDRMREIQRLRDDQGKMPADRRVANKKRKEHQNQWKELVMLIICGASEKVGNVVKSIYNGALKAMFYTQPVDPFNATPEEQEREGFTKRALYTGLLMITAAIGTGYYAYSTYQTADNEKTVKNLQDAIRNSAEKEAEALSTSSFVRKQFSANMREMISLKEDVGKAKTAQRILLDPKTVENGGFLLNKDVEYAVTQIDGPMAYVNEVSRFLGSSYEELKKRLADGLKDEPEDFLNLAEDVLQPWEKLKTAVDSGQSLESLRPAFKTLAINLQHNAEIFNPGLQRYLGHVEERLGHIIGKFNAMDETSQKLHKQLESVAQESIAAHLGTTMDQAAGILKSGMTKGRFELPEKEISDPTVPSTLQRIGESLFDADSGMLTTLWETIRRPDVQSLLAGSIFFGNNYIAQIISMSFTSLYSLFVLRGGFRIAELAAAGGAWAFGQISDIFIYLAQQCTDVSVPGDLTQTLTLQIHEISKSSGFFSSLGFTVCAFIATLSRSGEILAGGATALFKMFADSGVKFSIASSILSVAALIAEAIGYAYYGTRSWQGVLLSTKLPSLAFWGVGMILIMAYNGTLRKILLTPYLQYASYRKSLPSAKYFGGGITGGKKKYDWYKTGGAIFGIASLSVRLYNAGMILNSFVFSDYARTLNHTVTGVTIKTLGN